MWRVYVAVRPYTRYGPKQSFSSLLEYPRRRSLRARLPLRGLYTEETGGDMIRPLCSGSYNRQSSGVLCPFASMVLESVAVSLAKLGFDHGYPV